MMKNDNGDVVDNNNESNNSNNNRSSRWNHNSSRIIRVSRASGGKDRHSKVWTSKGLRDRRVRLSDSIAEQLYDLQDRLGYDQPNKALERLIKAAENSISELPSYNNTNFPMTDDENQKQTLTVAAAASANSLSKSACSSNSDTSDNSSGLSLSRSELRVKAIERARERTVEETKERDDNLRHSKVETSKGPRDRRVRLSVSTALQFYDLQDRLGYDRPSKAVEWLLKAAEDLISEPPSLNNTNFPMTTDDENQNQTLTVASSVAAGTANSLSCSSNSVTSKNSSGLSLSRSELRDKARERARERTAEETKERDGNNSNSNNHQTTSFIDLLNSGSDLVNSNRQWMAPSSSPAPMEYFSSGLILGPPGQTHFPIQTNAHPLSSISDHQHHLHQEFSFVTDHLISPAGTNGDGAFNIDSNISTTSGAGTAVASAGFSGFNRGTLQSSSTNHHHQSFLANLMKDKEAFCEFLSQRQPPRSLSESTAHDAIEFLLTLPSDRCNKAVSRLSKATFNEIDGDYKENPLGSPIVRTFLQERVKEQEEYGHKKLNPGGNKSEITGLNRDDDKENLLEKYLTTSDLSNLDSLVVHADEDAGKYVRSVTVVGGTERILQVEDEEGKPWQFGFSYLSVSQCYELTKGWSNYVKEKQLGAGDFVFFQRHRTDSSRLFIGFRRREAALGQWDYLLCQDLTSLPTSSETLESTEKPKEVEAALGQWDHLRCQDLTSLPTSSETLKLTEKLKEVETPVQLRIPEQSITGPDPILVIYCGDNQNSKERYFISYISNELCLRGFTPLIYDLTKSTVTGNLEMLQRSRIGIIIFSKNYACSRQCLDEFVAIVDHSKANNLVLLPVFFEVKIAYIRGQSGSFGKAFSRLENSVHTLVSIEKYTYRKGYEVILAKNIVRDVCLLLNSEANMNLRGSLQMKSILSILNCSPFSGPHIVGLWGMVGIGKTTIAGEIFRTQADRYEVCYYLPDFHKVCQTRGLSRLRDEFFSKISGAEKVIIDACDTKLSFTRDRFLCKKVLIVLDGVSNARDAEVLVGGFGWFSGGHTIILTSRNRQVLVQCNAKEIYEIQKLSKPESVHLCCQFATEQNWKGRTSLISELVNYASGNPLALRVLGSSLQKQCINDEKLHLRRFRQHPAIEIRDAFRISFDKLDDNETSIFLDLACFFRGENKDHVVNILDGCGFLTDLGIYGLIDEALISLVDNRIEMPNIFQDTCRFIVCQESNNTGKRSRLWDPNDIVDVLTNNSGTEAIEGLFLDASGLTFDLSPTAFEKMYRLRLLKLYYQTSKNHCKVCLPEGLYSLPDDLRLLHWERYPLGSLPRNFNPKNLVELNMPYSNVTKLWKGTENLEKLKRINLSHSRELTKFPRLSKARNLERIDLEGCTSLVKVNSSILYHHKLTFLNLKDCSRLRIMPTTVHLEALEVLNLSGCSELEDIQDFSPNLKELYLAGTAIRKLPSSIGCLGKLVTLDLENCNRLLHLPPEISNLKVVVTLSGKRPASSLDLSSVEDTASPYKRYRLKRVIETVILSLRKRKRENSVSRVIVRVNEETEEEKKVRDKLVDGDNDDDFDPFAGFCDDRQKSFLNIQKKLEDPDLSEEALVELLQNLECVDITLRDLQGTQIGRHVNRLQRHQSKNVQRLAKQLIKKWKETVDETVRLNQSGDLKPPSLIGKRKEDNSESQNKHHPYQFHHLKDKETSVPESSLSPIGLPFRPEKLEDPDLSEEALVELLQNLGYVDITLQLLQKSDIGQRVNRLQKHRSKNVQRLAKQLIKKWKDTVEESMRLNQPGDPKPPSLIGKGKEGNSESQNKHHLSQFHHPKDRETSVPDGSLNLVGLPLRPGKPVCALYVDTGNCSSGPTCIFDHPSMFPTHKNKSFVFSETPCLNQLGISSSIRDSSSELVEASSKKPRIDKYASSMASETPRLSPLGFSYSIGDSSSEHVEASTVSEITQATVDRDASDSWDVNEEDSQFWLHL